MDLTLLKLFDNVLDWFHSLPPVMMLWLFVLLTRAFSVPVALFKRGKNAVLLEGQCLQPFQKP